VKILVNLFFKNLPKTNKNQVKKLKQSKKENNHIKKTNTIKLQIIRKNIFIKEFWKINVPLKKLIILIISKKIYKFYDLGSRKRRN